MNRRLFCVPVLFAGILAVTGSTSLADTKADAAKAKKALQEVSEFVGTWNLEAKAGGNMPGWKDVATWGWRFKDGDAWLQLEMKEGKHLAASELKYVVDKKLYQLTTKGKDGTEQVFTGEFKKGVLKLEHKDSKTGDVHRMTLNTLSEGVRMAMNYERQAGGKGLFTNVYRATGTKDGESFAGGAAVKKPECIVTGGAASIAVSYMGKTYYVCCSGCRDEFNANPKKYVDEFEKKK